MTQLKFISLFIACYCIFLTEAGFLFRLVKLGNGEFKIIKTEGENIKNSLLLWTEEDEVAKAYYEPLINKTGWAFLEIHTNASYRDIDQVLAAGYLEGSITADLIYMAWYNNIKGYCDGRRDFCVKLQAYLNRTWDWLSEKINNEERDEYWHQVELIPLQLAGMAAGYANANSDPEKNLTTADILYMNLQGDSEDLAEAFKAEETDYNVKDYLPLFAEGIGHCSALIKVLPDGGDIFVSQVTWNTYQSMIRIQKKYVMPLRRTEKSIEFVPGIGMSFSSYPGVITSGDDFYLISSGLATLETTIGNGNASLWRYVQPTTVFEFIRSMVANRLARDGREWSSIFSRFNSGTYNNQWMIVDYNKFISSRGVQPKDLPDGLLWVLEQIPNNIHAEDMTSILREKTYWPSYNIPYFVDIFNASGNQEMVKKFGDWFTYDNSPRARIFQRDHGKVQDIETMLQLMRYNDYRNDPLSACQCNPPYSAENAISARCDLNPENGLYPFPALGHRQHGATDVKITSSDMFQNSLQFLSVSGPTYNESAGIPPFQWSISDYRDNTPHMGHPDKWTFDPIVYQWV